MHEKRERRILNCLRVTSLSLLSLALVACAGSARPKIEVTATQTITAPLVEATPTLTTAPSATAISTLTVTPSPTATTTPVFDYCHLDGKTDSPQITPTPKPTYYENQPNRKALERLNLNNTDFVFPAKKPNEREIQVFLFGIKYQDSKNLNTDLRRISTYLTNAFMGIPVNFGFLKSKSLPMGVIRFKDDLGDSAAIIFPSAEGIMLKEKVDAVFPQTVNIPVFIVNSDVYFGGAGKFIVSSKSESAYTVPHEIAHGLCFGDPCIDDGYRRYYPPGAIPNSELFTKESGFRPDIALLIENLNPSVVKMEGAVCNGEQLYTFYGYPSLSIMGDNGNWMLDYADDRGKHNRPNTFTPLQKAILIEKLNGIIEKKLSER